MFTFEAIVSNKTLRLSDITKSNDYKELSYGIPFVNDSLEKAYNAEKSLFFIKELSRERFMNIAVNWIKENLESLQLCYVVCFSQRPDQLSQWRGYADDGRGVSIGFDKEKFKMNSDYQLKKVEYDKRKQKGLARKISDKVLFDIKKVIKENSAISDAEIIEILNKYYKDMFTYLAMCKAPFFKEEQEWRLFKYDNQGSLQFDYIFSNNNLKKYVSVCFDEIISSYDSMDIRLGPKCIAKPEEVKEYIIQKGLNGSVRESKGTYK